MKAKRTIVFPLLFAMILSALLLSFPGCKTDKTSGNMTSEEPTTPIPPEEVDPFADDLPEKNYNNTVFRVLNSGAADGMVVTEFDFEKLSSDLVHNAIYTRNRTVEKRFGVVFDTTVKSYNEAYQDLQNCVLNNLDEYELIQILDRNAWSAAVAGQIYTVNELPYLNTDKPYYVQNINKALTVGDTQFIAYSSECLNSFEQTASIYYNIDMANTLGLENLYEAVDNNTWTFEKFYECAMKASLKRNTAEPWWDETDRYGLVGMMDMTFPGFWISAGMTTIGKDANNLLTFTAVGDESLYTLIDTTSAWFRQDGFWYSSGGRNRDTKLFMEGGALFHSAIIGYSSTLRGMSDKYGVLPYPKYTLEQKEYFSRVVGSWINVVPKSTTQTEMISIIMEALAAETSRSVMPQYYENALKSQNIRDMESVRMMELIWETRTMDLGDTIFFTQVRSKMQQLYGKTKVDVASHITGLETK